jgi:antitoxin StbD
MNAPFKIETILADVAVGISDLKKNPGAVVAAAQEQQVAILNRNKPVAYMISPEVWEYLVELQENIKDEDILRARLASPSELIEVPVDDL